MEGDYPWRFHPSSLSSPFIFHEISTQQYHDFNYCNPEKKSNDNGGSSMAGFTFDTDSVAHLNYFNEEFMSEVQKYQLLQKLIGNGDVNPMNKVSDQKLLLPKSEPVDEEEEEEEEELFRSGFLNSIDHTSSYHHGLMELQNVDHQFPLLLHEPYLKRSHVKPNFPLPASSSHPQKYLTLKSSTTSKCSSLQGKGIPQSIIARQRRKRISDRTQCLEKLMPWEKKMNTGTMLEEAYKYIKFLKAQVSVLESMPCQSSFITNSNSQMMMTTTSVNNVGSCYGGLEKLNRQQLLEQLLIAQSRRKLGSDGDKPEKLLYTDLAVNLNSSNQKVAETNKKNKAMTKHPYVGGRQSMAQIGHAYKKKYGTQPSRFCMFHKTRLRADGTCVNQVTTDLIELMEEDQERRRSESSSEFVDAPGPNDVFGSHMPPESRGRIRMIPFVSPTDAGFRNSSSGGVSGLRKENDGLRKELAELREIQERQGRDMAALMALIQQQQRPPSTSESSQQL